MKEAKNKEEKFRLIYLSVDDKGNIEKEKINVKKDKLYKIDFDASNYNIEVEDEKLCKLNENLSFTFKKIGQTKIYFTNKETKEFSYITLVCKLRIIPIIIPIITIGAASVASYSLVREDEKPTKISETTGETEKFEDYTEKVTNGEGDEKSQAVIIFPSNVTNIGVSTDKPMFKFENSKYNRVFFHYYIYNKESGKTIDVGQVAPGKSLEFDITKYFNVGVTEVRVDIKTFKDTSEKKVRNSMSFNSVIIIK